MLRAIWNHITRPSLAQYNSVVEASAVAETERLRLQTKLDEIQLVLDSSWH